MYYIPTNEITLPDVHADELGFVFIWQNHLLRGIYKNSVDQANKYFSSGFINEIVNRGLFPKTWISNFENEMFGIIIEHELITPVIYSTEWNMQMLIDAAKTVLEIATIGLKYGYNMIDCHTSNVLFSNNHAFYIDLGSFVPSSNTNSWKPYTSFCRSYLSIIDLWKLGANQVSKRILSPGMELCTEDYYLIKYPLFRYMRDLLKKLLVLREAVFAFASFDETTYKEVLSRKSLWPKSIIKYFNKYIKIVKPLKSQRLIKVSSSIKSIPCLDTSTGIYEKNLLSIVVERIVKEGYETLSIIGNPYFDLMDDIHKIVPDIRIVSIQDSNEASINEYYRYLNHRGVQSVHYKLYSGNYYVDKPAYQRLSSDAVLLFLDENEADKFYVHNSLVKVKKALEYSLNENCYIYMQNDSDIVHSIKELFVIELSETYGLYSLLLIKKK